MINNAQQKKSNLTEKKYLIPFVMITLLFFLWGFARAILDLLNKHFQNELGISITQSALIQVTTYMGYFLMAIPSGMLINKYGYRNGVLTGLTVFSIGSFLFIPGVYGGGFNVFLLALFVIGCGLTFLETSANPYITELGPAKTATSRLNLSQSFNGLGGMFATSVIGVFLFGSDNSTSVSNQYKNESVLVPYISLGIIVMLIAFMFSRVNLPEIQHNDNKKSTNIKQSLNALFKNKMFVLGLIALLCYEIAEISINSYFINFITGMGWMSDSNASLLLTFALAFFMIGRFVGSYIMRFVSATKMLLICATATTICSIIILLNLGKLSLIALIAIYLFEAIMFPTIFSLALKNLGTLTKSASSLLMMTPIGGCAFLIMGYLADHTNNTLPFVLPLVGYAIVLYYALICNKEKPHM